MMRRWFGLWVCCAAVFVPGAASAPQMTGKVVVLKAARLFDGKSDALVTPGLVVVTDGKITAVGANAAAPAGSRGDRSWRRHLAAGIHRRPYSRNLDEFQRLQAARNWTGCRKRSRSKRWTLPPTRCVTLMAGFTTVRDVGSHDFIDVGMRNAIRDGVVPGPRMIVSGYAIGATGGHCDGSDGFRPGSLEAKQDPCRASSMAPTKPAMQVRLMHKYGASVIKTSRPAAVLSPTDDVDTPQLTQEELNAIVDEAHALRLKVATHCHGAEAAKRAVRAGVNSIEHGTFLDDEALGHDEAAAWDLSGAETLMARARLAGATRQRHLYSAGYFHQSAIGHRACLARHFRPLWARAFTSAPAPTPPSIPTAAMPRNFTKWWTWV